MSNLNLQKLCEWVWPWLWTFKEDSAVHPRIRNLLRILVHVRTCSQRAHHCLLMMTSLATSVSTQLFISDPVISLTNKSNLLHFYVRILLQMIIDMLLF